MWRGEPAKDSVADGAQGSTQPRAAPRRPLPRPHNGNGGSRRRLLLLPAAFPILRHGDEGSPLAALRRRPTRHGPGEGEAYGTLPFPRKAAQPSASGGHAAGTPAEREWKSFPLR